VELEQHPFLLPEVEGERE